MSGLTGLVAPGSVLIDPPVSTDEQVIRALAATLLDGGAVHASLADAAVQRERDFPTGLLLAEGGPNAALPHADREHVVRSSIAVAVLREPIMFHRMDVPAESIAVRLVVLLALADPNGQLSALREIGGLLQQPDRVARILAAGSPAAVVAELDDVR